MRVLFLGTPDAAVPSLRALASSRHELVGACCQPDRPARRGHVVTAPPVKEAALELGLPVLQPESVRTAAFREDVAALRPEGLAVVAYGHILGPKLLELAPRGAFNLHFSLLPRWRGAAPVQRAIQAGDEATGVSVIRIVQELDAGPVLARLQVAIGPAERTPELQARLAVSGAPLLVSVLDEVEAGTSREEPQDAAAVTLAPPLRKEEGLLDPLRPVAELLRLLRAFDPWPGCRLLLPRGPVQVVAASAAPAVEAAPGTVLHPQGDALPIACADGVLLVQRAKPEGKAEMTGRSLVNGRIVAPGEVAARPPGAA